MVQFGTLDNIFMHVSEITKKSVRESLENNRDLAELSLRLATIKTDAEFDFTYDRARLGSLYTPEAHDMFRQLGFKNFLGRFDSSLQQSGREKLSVRVVSGREQTDAVFDEIKKAAGADVMPAVIFLTDDGTENGYIGMAAAWSDDSAVFIPDTEGE
jgi:DNA polymerase-1